jgi:hypothetical protein
MNEALCPAHGKVVTFKVLTILVGIFCLMTGGIYGVLSSQLSDHIQGSNTVLKELSDRQHIFNVNQRLIMYELNVKDPD